VLFLDALFAAPGLELGFEFGQFFNFLSQISLPSQVKIKTR
jgi:hypothetical protein